MEWTRTEIKCPKCKEGFLNKTKRKVQCRNIGVSEYGCDRGFLLVEYAECSCNCGFFLWDSRDIEVIFKNMNKTSMETFQ